MYSNNDLLFWFSPQYTHFTQQLSNNNKKSTFFWVDQVERYAIWTKDIFLKFPKTYTCTLSTTVLATILKMILWYIITMFKLTFLILMLYK